MSTSSASSPWSGASARHCGPFPRRSLEIGAIVLGFIYWWPLALAYVAWKVAGYPALGQMREFAQSGSWSRGSGGTSRFAKAFEAAKDCGVYRSSTGNFAFDEYRKAELDRLEARRRALQEESRAFTEFVEELKRAKDREQFDAYMAKKRAEGGGPTIDA
ncbi:DUF2852 domain-containing protein [Methylobacterium gnaphalii]|uniref:Membrane protein n=1 Tax=Methylobacterium gnaphalii TaxID=1010610 RepID=A0A512JNR2_9HYPH|nr:DUF2852 domain-containing protein [Methylobacterium gnaphalii]GEP11568.1 membrane protein [Methylobacterium gnaphalii]GJD70309.1 hypothetical protein MMMDOFMJ_3254 [Methylobacterium gnaphalii]GLS48815.1 membrane protein [Methylobacterium gnaphalii]